MVVSYIFLTLQQNRSIFTKCENCNAHDDFFINKDYYGYIDADVKPLSGEWKL
jgi:hypothetical protein